MKDKDGNDLSVGDDVTVTADGVYDRPAKVTNFAVTKTYIFVAFEGGALYPAYPSEVTKVMSAPKGIIKVVPVGPAVNDYICKSCRNDKCSLSEVTCWKCGNKL